MALDQRDLSIQAQNAGNSAAVIVAALIARAVEPPGVDKVIETFDRIRAHVLAGTLAAIPVTQPVGNQQYNYPPPENTGQPQQVIAQAAAPPVTTAQGVPQAWPETMACSHGNRKKYDGNDSKGPIRVFYCALPKDAAGRCDSIRYGS